MTVQCQGEYLSFWTWWGYIWDDRVIGPVPEYYSVQQGCRDPLNGKISSLRVQNLVPGRELARDGAMSG